VLVTRDTEIEALGGLTDEIQHGVASRITGSVESASDASG
jgi:hypothetical protein